VSSRHECPAIPPELLRHARHPNFAALQCKQKLSERLSVGSAYGMGQDGAAIPHS
jgi:hypothetical protein